MTFGCSDDVNLRWSFSEIEADRFAWRAQERAPDKHWVTRHRFHPQRVPVHEGGARS